MGIVAEAGKMSGGQGARAIAVALEQASLGGSQLSLPSCIWGGDICVAVVRELGERNRSCFRRAYTKYFIICIH